MGNAAAGQGQHFAGALCRGEGQCAVIVRVFVKKTQKTPRREIDLALSRAKEVG